MSTVTFATVEDAIRAAIREGIPAFRTVETWAGQLSPDDIESSLGSFPAAYVSYEGSTNEMKDVPTYYETVKFMVTVATESLRGGGDERTSASGAYALIEAVKALLVNSKLGLEMARLELGDVVPIYSDQFCSVYGIVLKAFFFTVYNP